MIGKVLRLAGVASLVWFVYAFIAVSPEFAALSVAMLGAMAVAGYVGAVVVLWYGFGKTFSEDLDETTDPEAGTP